jgi:hypothetical protein
MSVLKRPSANLLIAKKKPEEAKSTPSGPPCSGKKAKSFQKLIGFIKNNPDKIDVLLARALLHDDMLDVFDGYPHANECVFSYPDSDWFSVYLLDENGKKVWDPDENIMKLYFKIRVSPNGEDAAIIEKTLTNDTPQELIGPDGKEIENCKVAGTKCTNPDSMKPPPKEPKAPRAPKSKKPVDDIDDDDDSGPSAPSRVSPVILSQLENLSLGGGGSPGQSSSKSTKSTKSTAKPKITRDDFEDIKSKELIVDYMVANMNPKDIVSCVKKGALSKSDLEEVEKLAGMDIPDSGEQDYYVDEPGGSLTLEELDAVEMANNLPEKEVMSIMKRVTKEAIVKLINKIGDMDEKKKEIVKLCKRAGINKYSTKTARGGKLKLFENGEQVDDGEVPEIIDICAKREATKLRRKIALYSGVEELRSQRSPAKQSLDSIINAIAGLGNDEKKEAIVSLCKANGVDKYSTKKARGGKLKLFENDEQVDDDELDMILMECAQLEFKKVNSFGRRYRRH